MKLNLNAYLLFLTITGTTILQSIAFTIPTEIIFNVNHNSYPHYTQITQSSKVATQTILVSSQHQRKMNNYQQTSNNMMLSYLQEFILVPPANAADTTTTPVVKPPTSDEIKILRSAFEAFYGERNVVKAESLLSNAIDLWQRQPPDERAALYRVRGDCYMALLRAEDALKDYSTTLDLLNSPGGELADPGEKPAALLGRARSLRSLESKRKLTKDEYHQASNDYQQSLRLSSREDWDTDEENEQDGATRNPYAAWEWGMARRGEGDYKGAAKSHTLASLAFQDIGDKARSVISLLDAGIDLASSSDNNVDDIEEAKRILKTAIDSTPSVEGTDIALLQRVISKECEGRIALASLLWSSKDKAAAETQLAEACTRLDQLQIDSDAREALRVKSGRMPDPKIEKLSYTIDDNLGAGVSCSRFKNEKFLSESLLWPESLQQKVLKMNKMNNS